MIKINPKSNIQILHNWISLVKSVSDFYYYIIALSALFAQHLFVFFSGSNTKHKKSFLSKIRTLKNFAEVTQENFNCLKLRMTKVNVYVHKYVMRAPFKINIKLIKQKTFLSEIITIFMLYFKPANFVNSQRPIIYYTH